MRGGGSGGCGGDGGSGEGEDSKEKRKGNFGIQDGGSHMPKREN